MSLDEEVRYIFFEKVAFTSFLCLDPVGLLGCSSSVSLWFTLFSMSFGFVMDFEEALGRLGYVDDFVFSMSVFNFP